MRETNNYRFYVYSNCKGLVYLVMEKETSLKPIGHQEGQGETFRHELKPLFVGSISFPSGKPSFYL